MSSVAISQAGIVRPATVTAAVALLVFKAIVGNAFFVLPGADDVPGSVIVLGIVGTVVALFGAWGLWNLRRWGAILAFVLTLFDFLTSLPGLFAADSNWVVGAIIVFAPISLAILALLALPVSRRAYLRG